MFFHNGLHGLYGFLSLGGSCHSDCSASGHRRLLRRKIRIIRAIRCKKYIRNLSPIIGSNNNYWIKLSSILHSFLFIGVQASKLVVLEIIVRENKPLAATPKRESPSAMDYKKQISIIRIILSTNYNYRN